MLKQTRNSKQEGQLVTWCAEVQLSVLQLSSHEKLLVSNPVKKIVETEIYYEPLSCLIGIYKEHLNS